MINLKRFYKNKNILVTGATGFKGAWLAYWLLKMGANVTGLGVSPNKNEKLFYQLSLDKKVKLYLFDIRNLKKLKNVIDKTKPKIIFHLAAQPLVYESYKKPFATFDINYRGSLNIMECVRTSNIVKSVVIVTSDKCYESSKKKIQFKETDRLGGKDPYSASKSSAEIMVRAYWESFFKKRNIAISTGRAGNVIGGGDWSENRLIPDCIKSLISNKNIYIRNPYFNRPWQNVLESLKGYLMLAEKQYKEPSKYSGAWNFGPTSKSAFDVKTIVKTIINFWGTGKMITKKRNFYEQQNLQLSNKKAIKYLKWKPTYTVKESVEMTVEWYLRVLKNKEDPKKVTSDQIDQYTRDS